MSLSATRATLELQTRLAKEPEKAFDLRAALVPKAKEPSLRELLTAKKPPTEAAKPLRELLKAGATKIAADAESDFFGDSIAVPASAKQENNDVTISISVSSNGKVSIKS